MKWSSCKSYSIFAYIHCMIYKCALAHIKAGIHWAYTPKMKVPTKCMNIMLKRKRTLKTINAIVNGLFRSWFANNAKINPGIANTVGTNRRNPVKSMIVEI